MSCSRRRLQIDNWFQCDPKKPLPKTTYEETFDGRDIRITKQGIAPRKLINFQSYTMEDLSFDPMPNHPVEKYSWTTFYRRDFVVPPQLNNKKNIYIKDKNEDKREAKEIPFLWNRKVHNDFEWNTHIDFKFMDDHLFDLSAARKEINKYRQLRNSAFKFEELSGVEPCKRVDAK
ncbi:uncharacterized protein LOC119666310 [Teleopsis dalmanni]|uniref:uncharacterized protein LOC119666310 n=1 Tax=Teleopsis dalmanni TaxID=139649 RepID=UPI0018CF5BB6|nr:uncharacterized protein LOC119666310 [Teleopsis dalmanni]